ncbi:MAG: glycosyltransferase family 39 protein [Chloroflexi bacterium]|nr:glycosyltransferase family 39 protein [Chloroflexota bacterium]
MAGLVFLVALAFKGPEFFLPMGEDQGIFNYAGELLLRGGLLYRDLWETKPPAEYLFHAAVLALLPEPWETCWLATYATTCGQLLLHAVDLLYSFATALALYGVGRSFLRPSFAWVAALLGVVHLNAVMLSQEGSIPEKHLLLPMTLAVWAYLRAQASASGRWLLVAGFLAGLATLFKPPGVVVGGVLAAHLLLRGHGGAPVAWRAGRLALLSGGFALAWVPLVVYLLAEHLLADFWLQVVVFNLEQATSNPQRLVPFVVQRTWQVFSQSSGLLWLLAALGGGLLLLPAHRPPRASLWALWALGSTLSVGWGGAKLVQSYFLYLVPSFALLGGYALQRLWDMAGLAPPRWPALLRASLVLSCVVVLVLSSGFQRRVALRVWYDRWPHRTAWTMEEWLAMDLPHGKPLYIWGGSTQVYVLARARPPSRYVHAAFLSRQHSAYPSYLERRRELMCDLLRQPPATILIAPKTWWTDPDGTEALNLSTFPELERFLGQFYTPGQLHRREGWTRFNLRLPAGVGGQGAGAGGQQECDLTPLLAPDPRSPTPEL